ncbi:TonB family protein [Succinatimonas hippei]|uniref:TonB family protein n=1 Tax=Succinatimonas hippei TaxID=626938 RepID=UPI0026EF55CB|nr:TonB family protein [Succinatimonas hippei]
MDNLQTTADKLAGLVTVALLGAFCAGAFIYSVSSESKPVEETVKVQILSIEQEPPVKGDPEGGIKEVVKEKEVEEIKDPEPEPVVKEAPKPAPKVVKPEPKNKTVKKTPQKKKQPVNKKRSVKSSSKDLPKSAAADKRGNRNKRGLSQGLIKAQSSAANTASAYKNAFSSLLARVSSLKEYPSRARRQGIEGKCVINFKVNTNGVVTGAAVTQKSGQVVLDSACKRLGTKLIGFNTGAKGGDFNVKVPVNYRLVK